MWEAICSYGDVAGWASTRSSSINESAAAAASPLPPSCSLRRAGGAFLAALLASRRWEAARMKKCIDAMLPYTPAFSHKEQRRWVRSSEQRQRSGTEQVECRARRRGRAARRTGHVLLAALDAPGDDAHLQVLVRAGAPLDERAAAVAAARVAPRRRPARADHVVARPVVLREVARAGFGRQVGQRGLLQRGRQLAVPREAAPAQGKQRRPLRHVVLGVWPLCSNKGQEHRQRA